MMMSEFQTTEGFSDPLGLSFQGNLANFALFSSHADAVYLGLFRDQELVFEAPMYKTDDIWHIAIIELPKGLEYAYRCEGPKELLYNPDVWLMDPYAKMIHGDRARACPIPFFDWEGDQKPDFAKEDLLIYEMHVRGFTKHPSSQVANPGTFLGLIEKIPYLKKLGINAVELMPIYDFNEHLEVEHINPKTKQKLLNYWGYNPLNFFSPMDWYGVKDPVLECKQLIKELHKEGIKVILDVVYNHTGEGKEKFYYKSFRGIDHSVYYMLDQEGNYQNFSGCGNTLNVNHPIVEKMILDSLRYWVEEMHVDGFRFDLASIFTRDVDGAPMSSPPILQKIAQDPILNQVLLIAEAWDAAGLYQLGFFPTQGPFSEWNGLFRDVTRRFIKGTDGLAGAFANALTGSEMLYKDSKTPLSSINFITAHDGYCLRDLVTYQRKHNEENGENNRDGCNHNDSWNCGHEGPSKNKKIKALRERQIRNFLLALFLSQGIPMLLMGDEQGHTRHGNNNPYAQDNEINWFLWDQQNPKLFDFVAKLIAFRKQIPSLKSKTFLTEEAILWQNSWNPECRYVAYTLKGPPSDLFIAFNAHHLPATVSLPEGKWRVVINTEEDFIVHEKGPLISKITLLENSALVAKKV